MMLWKNTLNELIKIAFKIRSYIGIAALTVLILIVLFAMKADGKSYIGFVTASFEQTLSFNGKILNGNLVAFIIMQMLIVHVPLLISLVTGDLLSGEESAGTVRMLATKPISRTKIVLSKWFAATLYTLVMTLWLGFLSLMVSNWMFGSGDLIVLNSNGLLIIPESDLAWRFMYALMVAFLALWTVATISLTFSAFSKNSVAPIVSTMAVIILFTIIGTLDVSVFDTIKPFMFTTHMAAWRSIFEDPFPTEAILESVFVLLGHIGGLLAITIYRFNRKDITS
jgi:ABC-2 type transport system permease protein